MKAGLVFAGGFAKGAYQLGVIKAFKELLPPPSEYFSHISASSVGALNAYTYAADIIDVAEEAWTSLDFNGASGFMRNFYKQNGTVDRIIENVRNHNGKLSTNFHTTLLSLPKLKLNYLNLLDMQPEYIPDYLKACVCLPPFSKPIKIHENSFFDGAMVDNLPVLPLCDKDLDFVIVVYFDRTDYFFENEEFNKKVIRLNFMEKHVTKDSFSFKKELVQKMIDEGRSAAVQLIQDYNLQNVKNVNDIYKLNEERFLSSQEKKEKRISGDIFVDKFNKVVSKLLKNNMIQKAENFEHSKIVIK